MKGVRKVGIYYDNAQVKLEYKYKSLLLSAMDLVKTLWSGLSDERERYVPTQLFEEAEKTPTEWLINHNTLWVYKGNIYIKTDEILTGEQTRLLIIEEFDREREYFERLARKHNYGKKETANVRVRIPEAIRIEVWRRDGGKCAICGSRENLEYDHIVPVSKGGSNTARNIELLCEKHNRSKGAKIG